MRVALRAGAALRTAWERAKAERSTPLQLALSVGVGVFASCTPLPGTHLWIALGLATLFRLNRLWAALASRFSVAPVFLIVAFSEIEVAHRFRTGSWISLAPAELLAHGREAALDWALGTLLVGGSIAALAGVVAYAVIVSWPAPAADRPPSSGSPP